nr:zinc finger, CCHC-type [Tanacetum cinerariifolium]
MLMTMEPEIQRNLKPLHAHEMLKELKTLFAQQAEQELLQTTTNFHSCRQKEGQSVSSYVLKMKGYIDNLERLGHPVTLGLGVSLILIGLRKEYDGFVQNYNMHNMRKTVNEFHAMLKLHKQTLNLPKSNAPALHVIRAGKGLRDSRKLKPGALSLYVGNGQREAVEAIGAFYLCLPSGLEISFGTDGAKVQGLPMKCPGTNGVMAFNGKHSGSSRKEMQSVQEIDQTGFWSGLLEFFQLCMCWSHLALDRPGRRYYMSKFLVVVFFAVFRLLSGYHCVDDTVQVVSELRWRWFLEARSTQRCRKHIDLESHRRDLQSKVRRERYRMSKLQIVQVPLKVDFDQGFEGLRLLRFLQVLGIITVGIANV